jgi:hypothetical protein
VSYNVTFTVTNTRNDVSEPSTFILSDIDIGKENGEDVIKETVFGSCDVPSVRPGDEKKVRFKVEIPKEYFGKNVFHLAPIGGAIYYNYDPENPEGQAMAEAFTDYVQASEAPVAQDVTQESSKNIQVGQSCDLKIKIEPLNAKLFANLSYESSDPSVATVDENGIITGIKEGKCAIIVTSANGIRRETELTVTKNPGGDGGEDSDPSSPGDDNKPSPGGDDQGNDVPDISGGSERPDNSGTAGSGTDKKSNIFTGDRSPVMLIVFVLIISGGVIAVILVSKRRKEK